LANPGAHFFVFRIYNSLGLTLTDALDDLIGTERIDPQLAMKVLTQFDRIVAEALNEKVKARLSFKVNLQPFLFVFLPNHSNSFQPCFTKELGHTVNLR
jgi:transcription initiation factor TFIIA small subunit